MCLILIGWKPDPETLWVCAANRDEAHTRPTDPAHWWGDHPGILAGRDRVAGGTWMGVTRTGRFAALTYFRDPARVDPAAPSRGALVTQLLRSERSVGADLAWLGGVSSRYNPFNVLWSDGKRLGIYESVSGAGRELGPGIYGLSNHLLDTPWPKLRQAKARFAAALTGQPDPAALMELLRDDACAPDEELPATGIPLEWERLLSSAFIRAEGYGTRSTTVVRRDRRGQVGFDEWCWDAAGTLESRQSFSFVAGAPN